MPRESSAGRISIRLLDDLLTACIPGNLSPDRLKLFQNHPFKAVQDEVMRELVESVREKGVIELILCHLYGEDGYQIVSGHRCLAACKLVGLGQVPVTVRDM